MSIGFLLAGIITALMGATLSLAFGGSASVAFAVYVITGQLALLALITLTMVHLTREPFHDPR